MGDMKKGTRRYDFDIREDRSRTNSEKYDGLYRFAPNAPKKSIPLWIADMDFRTAPEIVEAMKRRVDSGIFGYTDIYDDSYYEAVCGWMEQRHGWKASREEIIVESGVVPAIRHGLSLLASPGDGAVIQTPAYRPFYSTVCALGMNPVFSPLKRENGRYEMDFEDLERKASDAKNRVLILCSPHNPSGRVWTEEELTRVMDICRRHGTAVICDEIHSDIVREGVRHIPMGRLFPGEHRLIVCTSPSKTFNLAGNHLANIFVADRELRERWEQRFHYMPNPISVEAAAAACREGGRWADELNRYLDGTFQMMTEFFSTYMPGIRFTAPEATYLAWIDMRSCGLSHKEMVNRFVENGLIIEGGEQFVAGGEGFVRMNIAAPRRVIEEALERMKGLFAE